MSNPPRELPGLYYDTERRKYFPLTQQRRNQFKKQKLDSQLQNQNVTYWDKCFLDYSEYVKDPTTRSPAFTNEDLYVICNIMALKERGANLFNELSIKPIDITFGGYSNKLLGSFSFSGGYRYWCILSDGRILVYEKDTQYNQWDIKTYEHNITGIDELNFNPRFEELTIFNVKRSWNNIFIHYKVKQKRTTSGPNELPSSTTQHLFHQISNSLRLNSNENPYLKCFTKLGMKEFDNINDSIATSYGPILAVKKKLFIFNWHNMSIKTKLKFNTQSDITAIACYDENTSHCYIYCGTRNGYLYKLTFSKKSGVMIPEILSTKCYKNICKVSSIVSIVALSGNRIMISGFMKDAELQYLFIIDLLELDSNDSYTTANPTILVTKFRNATNDTEILSISDNEQYVCYGKRNDFEMFSLRHRNYEQNGNCYCHPYASSLDFLRYYPPDHLFGFKLSSVSFTNNNSVYRNENMNCVHECSSMNIIEPEKYDIDNNCKEVSSLVLLMSFQSSNENITNSSLPINKLISAYIF